MKSATVVLPDRIGSIRWCSSREAFSCRPSPGVSCPLSLYEFARWRDFRQHRAWMIRGYAPTFAAVPVCVVSGILYAPTGDVILAVNSGVLSWPLNLIIAEWLIRREPDRALARAVA